MKIPKTLQIGGHTYTVEITKADDDAKGHNNWGKTIFPKCKIYLDESLPQSRLEETFLHELLHVAMDQSGINTELDKDKEENYVNRISMTLFHIMKVNKLI